MDLNLAMRYVMVQAKKEVAGNSVRADHLFLGILMLSKKNASNLTPDVHLQSRIETDLRAVKGLLEKKHIQVEDVSEKLRFLLNNNPHQAGMDSSDLLLRAMDICKQRGKMEVTAAIMLELILNSPTALVGKALALSSGNSLPGDETAFQMTGASQNDETVLPERGKFKPEQKPKPKPEPEADDDNEVIFFDIPKPDDEVRPAPQKPPVPRKPQQSPKEKRRTRINGYNLSGGVVWAAIKYFFWSLAVPVAILMIMEYKWHLLSDPPSNKFLMGLPYSVMLVCAFLVLYGIVSLIKHRFQAFATFLYFPVNITLLCMAMAVNMWVQKKEALTTLDLVCVWICVFGLLIFSLSKLYQLKNVSSGKSHQMNSMMLRLGGTPSIIFFTYLLRLMFIPLLACGIVSIFHLSVNTTWKAIFSIYGFILAWDVIRMIFQCNMLRFSKQSSWNKERKKYQTWNFLLVQHQLMFLPELGLLLMWYFNWFPMKTWVIWVYCIYGLIWLSASGLTLLSKEK